MFGRLLKNSSVGSSNTKRCQQINTLQVFNQNVTEVKPDLEYHVLVSSGGNDITLIVTLPANFPAERPRITVQPPVSHLWVDKQQEVVAAPGLLNYSVHSDLGRIVQTIVREFEKHPPTLVTVNQPTLETFYVPTPSSATCVPALPPSFPELQKLSLDELQELLNNDDRMSEFVENLPQMSSVVTELTELQDSVKELAEKNISRQPELEEKQQQNRNNHEVIQDLLKNFDDLTYQHQRLSQKYSPVSIQECLQAAGAEAEEQSEQIAEQFLNGGVTVDGFLLNYMESRQLGVMRKVKEEKLHKQLLELQKAGF